MNQTQEQLERLAELDAQAATFARAAGAQQEAAGLRVSIVTEAQEERRRQVAAQTHTLGAEAVVEAKGDMADWRAEFMAWVSDGQELIKDLADIEGALMHGLRNLVAGVHQSQGRARDPEEAERFAGQTERQALAAFQAIGALDAALSPWPKPGNGWAAAMIEATRAAVGAQGQVYNPSAGMRQFRNRRTTGAH